MVDSRPDAQISAPQTPSIDFTHVHPKLLGVNETPAATTSNEPVVHDGTMTMTPITTPGWNSGSDGQASTQPEGGDGGGAPELSVSQSAILDAANAGIGQQLWQQTEFAGITNNGRLGAAAAVSQVLRAAGYEHTGSASIRGLEEQLLQSGFEKRDISQARPGDVLILERNAAHRAIGVVGQNGQIYMNDMNGTFRHRPMPQGARGYVIASPDTCNE